MEMGGKKNGKTIEIEMGQNRWQTECCQDDCASPLSFISQTKLHDLETRDQFISVKSMPEEIRNIFL